MNEPVAWMYERPNGSAKLTFVREPMAGTVVTETPLYTYSAKILTPLTDEEILKEWTWKYSDCFEDFLLQFARAILRKAQEK